MEPRLERLGSEGTFAHRANVFSMVESGLVDERVLHTILGGTSRWDEPDLWDFKRELPWHPPGVKLPDGIRADRDAKVDEIVKDAVAFYNSFGGYLIVGVSDDRRTASGFDKRYDVENLNKRIRGATGHNVECLFRTLDWRNAEGSQVQLGLLFVPRRPPLTLPAQFKGDAHKPVAGRPAFKSGDFYFRQRDECRPAQSAEDFAFLYSDDRRKVVADLAPLQPLLDNNLPDRDGELGKFIGRETDMATVWEWLSDRFSPVRLICGLGGVGKTSLAYQFGELFAYARPSQFDKLVWLGAKRSTWQASRGEYATLQRIDFFDVDGFLRKLALELGCPDNALEEAASRQDLMALTVEHLAEFRFLVIVDDVDTLEDEDQQTLYFVISTMFAQAQSKALMTARRNLGMPRGQYIELGGIDEADFAEFVESKCSLLKIPNPAVSGSAELAELFKVSGGSPLFTVSILRFVDLGETFRSALNRWSGAAGEKVREAAFAKEVGRLSVANARVLLAVVYLRETSPVELAAIVGVSAFNIAEAIAKLRDFSMVEVASDLPGGATILVPRTLTLMAEVIERRVANYGALKAVCVEQRSLHKDPVPFVRDAVRRCMAHLTNKDFPGAAEVATEALAKLPEHPDLLCLVARCKLALGGQHRSDAIGFLQAADSKGCRKNELFELWIEVLERDRDWVGIIAVIRSAEIKLSRPGRFCLARARAYVELANDFMRANRYKDAEKVSLDGAEDIKNLLKNQLLPLFWMDAREAQKTVIRKWLAAISLQCPSDVHCSRLLGAVIKAAQDYGWLDVPTAELAVSMGSRHFMSLDQREKFSPTAYEGIALFSKRLRILHEHAGRLPSASRLAAAIVTFGPLVERVLTKAGHEVS